MRSSCTISQPIIVQSAFVYSIEVGDIMVLKIKVLPLLRRIEGYSAVVLSQLRAKVPKMA